MNSSIITVPDWARSYVQHYASVAYNLSISAANVPTIIISNGIGANIEAVLDAGDDSIQRVSVTNGGSGYSIVPDVIVSGGGGSGAVLQANINASGEVISMTIISGGHGYTSVPTITISGFVLYSGDILGNGAAAVAYLNKGKVVHCNVLASGSGYIDPCYIAFASSGTGAGAAARALIVNGAVVAVTMTNEGSGYNSAPAATVNTTGGGAQAIAQVAGGVVSNIVITNGGSNYTSTPSVYITGGTGTGATATATVTNGVVTAIAITSGGSGYVSGNNGGMTPYPGAIVASQNAHETAGIAALASRGSSGNTTITLGKSFAKGLIDSGNLTGLPTSLLSTISSVTSTSFASITALIGKKALYVGDSDTTYLAQTMTATTPATYYARLAARMEEDNYIRERASQDFAVGYAPQFAKEEVNDAEILRKAGLYIRQYLQTTYEPLNRIFIESQECNVSTMEIFGNVIRAITGSQQTQTTENKGASALMQGVGIVTTGLGLYNALSTAGVFGSTTYAAESSVMGAGALAAAEASAISAAGVATAEELAMLGVAFI